MICTVRSYFCGQSAFYIREGYKRRNPLQARPHRTTLSRKNVCAQVFEAAMLNGNYEKKSSSPVCAGLLFSLSSKILDSPLLHFPILLTHTKHLTCSCCLPIQEGEARLLQKRSTLLHRSRYPFRSLPAAGGMNQLPKCTTSHNL